MLIRQDRANGRHKGLAPHHILVSKYRRSGSRLATRRRIRALGWRAALDLLRCLRRRPLHQSANRCRRQSHAQL